MDYNFIRDWHYKSSFYSSHLVDELVGFANRVQMPNFRVLDVGSCTGRFLQMLNGRWTVEEAVLIEPVKDYSEFSRTVLDSYYTFENFALEDETKISYISINREDNLGVSKVSKYGTEPVAVFKFDDIAYRYGFLKPNLIKIDTEGSDFRVLWGMREYLLSLESKPIIVLEVCPRDRIEGDMEISYEEFEKGIKEICSNNNLVPDGSLLEDYSKDLFLLPKELIDV